MKRADIYAAARAAAILEWGEDDGDAVYVETEARVEGALWALEQVRKDLTHFVSQVKETDGYYQFELDDLPKLCDVEDDK